MVRTSPGSTRTHRNALNSTSGLARAVNHHHHHGRHAVDPPCHELWRVFRSIDGEIANPAQPSNSRPPPQALITTSASRQRRGQPGRGAKIEVLEPMASPQRNTYLPAVEFRENAGIGFVAHPQGTTGDKRSGWRLWLELPNFES